MKFEETIQCCYDNYPSLFGSRWQVLNQLFCVIGNGYKWENGQLCAVRYEDDAPLDYVPVLGPDGKAYQPPDILRAKLKEWYEGIFENISYPIYDEKMTKLMEEAGIEVKTKESQLEKALDEHIEQSSIEHISLYPLSEYSAIFTIPEDIQDDWLEGIKEVVKLLLKHGHGGSVNEMNDWQKDQRVEWTAELIKLADKLGVSR